MSANTHSLVGQDPQKTQEGVRIQPVGLKQMYFYTPLVCSLPLSFQNNVSFFKKFVYQLRPKIMIPIDIVSTDDLASSTSCNILQTQLLLLELLSVKATLERKKKVCH